MFVSVLQGVKWLLLKRQSKRWHDKIRGSVFSNTLSLASISRWGCCGMCLPLLPSAGISRHCILPACRWPSGPLHRHFLQALNYISCSNGRSGFHLCNCWCLLSQTKDQIQCIVLPWVFSLNPFTRRNPHGILSFLHGSIPSAQDTAWPRVGSGKIWAAWEQL